MIRKSVHYIDSFAPNDQKKLHGGKNKYKSHNNLHLKRKEHRIGSSFFENSRVSHSLEDLTSHDEHSVTIFFYIHNNYGNL